jgi:hypothetical protein
MPPTFGGTSGQVYVDQMFNLGGAAVTALTAMNGGVSADGSGKYSPKKKGHLISISIMVTPQAASSLAQSGYLTLNNTEWAPVNTLTIPFAGFGLATAPQLYGGAQALTRWEDLMLPVDTANPIIGNVLYAYSPVTPFITVTGKFTTN